MSELEKEPALYKELRERAWKLIETDGAEGYTNVALTSPSVRLLEASVVSMAFELSS